MFREVFVVLIFVFQTVSSKSIPAPSEIKQTTKDYSCCSGHNIPLNLKCQNTIIVGNKPMARVTGSNINVQEPFAWDGVQMKVDGCVDFLLQKICHVDGFDVEQNIQFKSFCSTEQTTAPDAAAALSQGWALVLLLISMKVLGIVDFR